MSHRVLLASVSTALAVALLATAAPASGDATTDEAIHWLSGQQQPDGGFETANFPPFEGPDAILAIADHGQVDSTWSESEAFAAVQAHDADPGNPGGTPLEWADDFLSGATPSPGIAAKFIVLVAVPLGLSTTAFDPAGDGSPINLEAIMDAGELPDHSYGAGQLNATLYAVLAHAVLGRPAPQDTIAYIRSVQQRNGGWNFAGDASGTDTDPDTTGLAIEALIANGVPPGDADVAAALSLLAALHRSSGAWRNPFGTDDPNSTSVAIHGIAAAGWNPTVSCWRTSSNATTAGRAYVDPEAWLRSQQRTGGPDTGSIMSPNDTFGINTFATTQTVQALERNWLPVNPASRQPSSKFVDLPGCVWFTQAVAWVDDHDIASGYADGTFRPTDSVRRGQVVNFLWNMMDRPEGAPDHFFVDVPASAAYNEALDWAKDEGLVTGFANNTFRPRDPVNRGQVVNMLWHMVGEPTGSPDHGFSDVPASAFYNNALDWAKANGIVSGFADNTYRPKNPVTRAQLANMLYRIASTQPAWGAVDFPSTVEFPTA